MMFLLAGDGTYELAVQERFYEMSLPSHDTPLMIESALANERYDVNIQANCPHKMFGEDSCLYINANVPFDRLNEAMRAIDEALDSHIARIHHKESQPTPGT